MKKTLTCHTKLYSRRVSLDELIFELATVSRLQHITHTHTVGVVDASWPAGVNMEEHVVPYNMSYNYPSSYISVVGEEIH